MILYECYKRIKDKTADLTTVHGVANLDGIVLQSSFIRNLEFNLIASSSKIDNLYFHLPILRGICEDIIFNNYIYSVLEKRDRKAFILLYQALDWKRSLEAQETFFTSVRNFQPILTIHIMNELLLNKMDIDFLQRTLKEKYGWDRNRPTIKQIAQDGGIIELYEFLYAATSRLVHFNPQGFVQMTWGRFEVETANDQTKMNISLDYFKDYYNEFCLFYGYYLFKVFITKFNRELNIEVQDEIDKMDEFFAAKKRWPEVITFEEMGISLEQGIKMFYNEKNGK